MIDFHNIINAISNELKNPLPGLNSQLKMSPSSRNQGLKDLKFDEKTRDSGVLILLYPKNGIMHLAFIKRASSGGPHSGQIGLPGGKWEVIDRDLIETALREAEEEIGVIKNDILVLGKLTELFVPVSNMRVQPVVGYIKYFPEFKKQIMEVDEIIEISLCDFADKQFHTVQTLNIREYEIIAPSIMVNGHTVWGATAMIMSEFLDIMKNAGVVKN